MSRAAPRASLGALLACAALLAACADRSDVDGDGTTGVPSPAEEPSPTGAEQAPTDLPEETAPPTADPEWTALPDAPLARLEMATAAHDGRIWLAGGLSPDGRAVEAVAVFDPGDGSWSEGPSLPAAVHHAALVSDDERLLLIGGYEGSGFSTASATTWRLEPGAESWTSGPALPSPRSAGAAAWDGERVVYGGGVGPNGVAAEVFALESDAWRTLDPLPAPREHLAAASDGSGRVWLLGGRVGGLDTNVADVALVEGDEVVAIAPLSTARGGVAAFFVPGLGACLTGGEAPQRTFAEVECVDADGSRAALPAMLAGRHGHGAAVVEGTAYVLLGGPRPGLSAHAALEALDLTGIGD